MARQGSIGGDVMARKLKLARTRAATPRAARAIAKARWTGQQPGRTVRFKKAGGVKGNVRSVKANLGWRAKQSSILGRVAARQTSKQVEAAMRRLEKVRRINRSRAGQSKASYRRLVARTRRGRVEAAKIRAARLVKSEIGRLKAIDRKNSTKSRIARIEARAAKELARFNKTREKKVISRIAAALGGRRGGRGGAMGASSSKSGSGTSGSK